MKNKLSVSGSPSREIAQQRETKGGGVPRAVVAADRTGLHGGSFVLSFQTTKTAPIGYLEAPSPPRPTVTVAEVHVHNQPRADPLAMIDAASVAAVLFVVAAASIVRRLSPRCPCDGLENRHVPPRDRCDRNCPSTASLASLGIGRRESHGHAEEADR